MFGGVSCCSRLLITNQPPSFVLVMSCVALGWHGRLGGAIYSDDSKKEG
jgi:hypothetical protein